MSSHSQSSGRNRSLNLGQTLERWMNKIFVPLTLFCALSIVGILLWITFLVGMQALPAIEKFGLGFLFSTSWDPVRDQFGALPQLYGTLISAVIALFFAIPVGLGVALFLSEDFLPPKVQVALAFLVELLAAIPSVVYGLWGLFVIVPLFKQVGLWLHENFRWIPIFNEPPSATGLGMLPAGVVLAIMVLPTIAVISRDSLISLPPDLRQASLGLGATRWETIIQILIPAAFSGIVGAVMLALGRALGETMAVTMLIGNANNINVSILKPANTVASLLANQFAEASGLQVSALMYASLMLFALTLLVNILAEILVRRVQRI
ncbi:MAG: phosphate ABC transporter permease subunit PstC [Microcoleus vaginatus WJT46-NPBG5]|jgi:phosphate transport system permease protein|nr:phosphate ABC transporter permease subunit PstC [Microcoleus vaginatus WJT46-NPBG5]